MKIQLETITSKVNRSFTMMFNPKLSDLFFWHFHSEYEIVYIEAPSGTCHVGNHNSTFKQSDLVLIGSNVPHLNFDYGIKSAYRKVVVHLKKEFVEQHFKGIPELTSIFRLFDKAKYGVSFKGKMKKIIGGKLFGFEHMDDFTQYVQLIEVLKMLADIPTIELLHDQPYQAKYSNREQGRLKDIYAFIDENYHQKIELQTIANISNMTKEAFCRYFKKVSTYTFVEFLNRYRIGQSKLYLMRGETVSDACYNSGFESLSYYNRVFRQITQENPSDFRKRYL